MLCFRKESGEFWGPSDWDSAFTDKDMGSVFGQGTKILQAAQFGQKENFFFQIYAVGTAQDFLAEVQ